MSVRAVSLGIVKRLREALGDETGAHIGYRPSLRPPPVCGQWYVAVGQNSAVANGRYGSNYTEYRHTVVACLTFKYGYVPDDRLGSLITSSTWNADGSPEIAAEGRAALVEREEVQPGMMEMAELIQDCLIEDYETLKAINYFLGTDKNGAVQTATTSPQVDTWWQMAEPFHSGTVGPPVAQDASWVGGTAGTGTGVDFWTMTVTVAGATSIRPSRYARGLDLDGFATN
jgi:hypothetical protein